MTSTLIPPTAAAIGSMGRPLRYVGDPGLDRRREAEVQAILREAFAQAGSQARALARAHGPGMVGFGVAELRDGDRDLALAIPFANLITSAGDRYYAQMAVASILPAAPSAPHAASGMRLGTGAAPTEKSGVGAALITYISGSNSGFDAGFPAATAADADNGGWLVTYKATWPAGDVVSASIAEVAIVNNAGTDEPSTAADTYARAVISPLTKTDTDALTVTWTHKFLGS